VEYVPGAGDLFYRDTARRGKGGRGTVLLLHGWMVPSDPHWFRTWSVLERAGWRVVALDARGHGRGLRTREPFRLTECSEDAAALVRHLDCGPVLMRTVWSGMGIWQLYLRLAPQWTWETAVRAIAHGDRETTAWAVGELRRGAAWDIAEAGREIGRFDSRAWVGSLETPMAVVLTTVDVLVPPARQRELARRIGVTPLELRSDHLAPATTPRRFHACLLEALDRLESQGGLRAVADSVSG